MYEKLLNYAAKQKVQTYELEMSKRFKGIYEDNVILINKDLSSIEKACVLAEELGHYYTTHGNILDQSKTENRKQEQRARNWACSRMVTLDKFIDAYKNDVSNIHEFAELVCVTEEFMQEALDYYRRRYGISTIYKGYLINFERLAVIQLFE